MECGSLQDAQSRQNAVYQCLAYDLAELEASLADARRSLMQLKMLAFDSSGLPLTRTQLESR